MNADEVRTKGNALYIGSGYDRLCVLKWVEALHYVSCDLSEDRSLNLFYFKGYLIVCGWGVNFEVIDNLN
jgi:hypothetical protein